MAISQGFCPKINNILNGNVIRTKVYKWPYTIYRKGGCSSGVATKRGSTVTVDVILNVLSCTL